MIKDSETPPRIERLKVRNFRALRDVKLTHLTPLTVLLGPNGSGKSTVFDVFAFLCRMLRGRGCAGRGRSAAEHGRLKSRGRRGGPVLIEIAYREQPRRPLITYHLEVDERSGRPVVTLEWLRWKRGRYGAPFRFLDYANGLGRVISGDLPDAQDDRIEVPLSSPDTLAVNALGQLAENPRVRRAPQLHHGMARVLPVVRGREGDSPRAGPEERPEQDRGQPGQRHPVPVGRAPRAPGLDFRPAPCAGPQNPGRGCGFRCRTAGLLLKSRDAPFAEPVMARFASDGTLKMLAYLALLHDPVPPPFIGIEEPENFLHPPPAIRAVGGMSGKRRKRHRSS